MRRQLDGIVKAISVRQPWAWAILHAGKRHENRGPTWARAKIPPVLALHAAKGCTREEYADAVDTIQAIVPGIVVPLLAELPRGGLVGLMRMGPTVQCERRLIIHPETPWFFGPVGLTILEAAAFPFVPMKGMLGLFDTKGTEAERPAPEVCAAWNGSGCWGRCGTLAPWRPSASSAGPWWPMRVAYRAEARHRDGPT